MAMSVMLGLRVVLLVGQLRAQEVAINEPWLDLADELSIAMITTCAPKPSE
jgi:hypothetical protein